MKRDTIQNNPMLHFSLSLSTEIVRYTAVLNKQKMYPLANQLFRWGTAVGANAFEAQNAESKADFVHKMKLTAKEPDETFYWLLLFKSRVDLFPSATHFMAQLKEISNVLHSFIASAKRSLQS